MILILAIGLNLSQSLACTIDQGVTELAYAQTEIEKEDALDSIGTSLIFCGPEEYAKAALAVYKNSNLGDYFIPSLLFQYGQLVGNSFQIGEDWNRKALFEMEATGAYRYLLRVGTATGTYIGQYNGKGVIVTNRHVLDNENCDEIMLVSYGGVPLVCSKFIISGSDLDFAFILLDTVIDVHPPQFEWKRRKSATGLLTAGRGMYLNEEQDFLEESSELCQIFLPDEDGESMGCDSSPGDSGSPIFIKKERKLYGIANSTGNHILNFTNNNYYEILYQENLHGLISLQSSHMVPLYRIRGELKNSHLTEEARAIIYCMLDQGCLE